jgi:DNA-binding response OmpR family regulator
MLEELVQTKKKILLVDDEQAILRVLKIKLKLSGYDVVTASCGQEALDLVKTNSLDMMLLDVIMPGMDGFEVLRRLRATSQLPVIVYSARAENAQQAMKLGANRFIGKPFDVDELVTLTELVIDHHEK